MNSTAVVIYQLRVALSEVAPPIWRVVEVPADFSLDWLHDVIQWSMGWEHEHDYRFYRGEFAYVERPQVHLQELGKELDATNHSLEKVFGKRGRYLRYVYDLKDTWWHHVWLEDVFAAAPETAYPRLVDGRRSCPPEEFGGVADFQAYLAGRLDPDDERMQMMEGFDVEDFDEGPRPFPNARIYVPAQSPRPPRRRRPFDADAAAMLGDLADDVEAMLAVVDDDEPFCADLRRAIEDVTLADDALPPKTVDTLDEARTRGLGVEEFLMDCVRHYEALVDEYSTAPFHAADILSFWRVDEAVEVFAAVVEKAPEDAEAMLDQIMRALVWSGPKGTQRLLEMLGDLSKSKQRSAVEQMCREGVRDERIFKRLRRAIDEAGPEDTHTALLISEYGGAKAMRLLSTVLDAELDYLLESSSHESDDERGRHADYAVLLAELITGMGQTLRPEQAEELQEVMDYFSTASPAG